MDLKKLLIFFFLVTVSIIAQKDSLRTYQVSDVVVTATRTLVPLSELANSISVIDSAEIANRHSATILDLLKEEYGLSFTQQGGSGKLAYVNMRGGNPSHTLVMIDGIEMNMPSDPSNTYDFSYLTPDNVNRIEVLRGPQSTLYGSDAVSGVINIITRKGIGAPSYSVSAEGGSYGTYKGMAGLSGSLNVFNYSVTLSKYSTKGFTSAAEKYGNFEKDPSTFYNVSSRIGANLSPDLSFSLISRYSTGKSDYDQLGGKFGDDPTYVFDFQELANRLEGTASLFNGFWKPTVGLSFMRNIRKYAFDPSANYMDSSRSHYDGLKMKFDLQNNLQLAKWNLLAIGVETEKEISTSEYFSKFFNSIFDEQFSNTAGVFIQDQFNIDDALFATAGVRYDWNNKFGSIVTYRIAPAYLFKDTGTRIKFTFGNAFKTPSLFYLFDPQFGNPALKPEKSTGWDAGVEQNFSNFNLTAGATFFSNTFTNLFGFDQNYKTVNINKAESYGVEVFSTVRITESVKFKYNYTLTKTKELEGPNKGQALIRRPEIKIGFILSADIFSGLNSMFEVLYVGERSDKDFSFYPSVDVKLPSYTLVNISASYSFFKNLEVYGRVNNLFDADYEEILGYSTSRLSGYAGFRINL